MGWNRFGANGLSGFQAYSAKPSSRFSYLYLIVSIKFASTIHILSTFNLAHCLLVCKYLYKKQSCRMKFFQKILKKSLAQKFIRIFYLLIEYKAINYISAAEDSAKMLHLGCKNELINDSQSTSAILATVEKSTQLSKELQHIKSVLILLAQMVSLNSNLVFIWNRA